MRTTKPRIQARIPIPMDLPCNAKAFVGTGSGTRIERILCAVDFSQFSARAYAYAQSIAGHYRATLVVQHIVELWQHPSVDYCVSPHGYEDFRRKFVADGQNDLQKFVDRSSGIKPERIVQEGVAADAILSLARERAISLIVMGTHGRRGFDHLMLGSVTERVLRNASCPVLVVHQAAPVSSNPTAADDSVRIRRILCCVDFSRHSERAVKYALSLADAYDSEVTVLHVLDAVSDAGDIGTQTARTIENLEKLIPSADRGSKKARFAVRPGKAYIEILQFAAEAQSDMIVTGVRGRHALDLAVFGSTTYRAIQLGLRPVLTVPIESL
jgi:nucleotide-binding universal stress UspA family protein